MTATLLANDPPLPPVKQKDVLKSGDFYIWMGVLIGALLVAALVVYIVDRWRKRGERGGERISTTLELTDYREMYENGEITQGEYDRIRGKLAAKMKREVGLAETGGANKATATDPPAAPPPPPPAPE